MPTAQKTAKHMGDIEIEVVDNGFTAKVGDKTFVFEDLSKLDDWIKENFGTPKKAKKTIKDIKGIDKPNMIDKWTDIDKFVNPIIQPNIQPQWTTTSSTVNDGELLTYEHITGNIQEKMEEEV